MENNTNDQILNLIETHIVNHDIAYSYSDDAKAWKRGQSQHEEIVRLIGNAPAGLRLDIIKIIEKNVPEQFARGFTDALPLVEDSITRMKANIQKKKEQDAAEEAKKQVQEKMTEYRETYKGEYENSFLPISKGIEVVPGITII